MENKLEISLNDLVGIMKKLLDPGGCPWDREQNHKTLKPYMIEEAYEVCEAIDKNNLDELKEELGDVLLQVVFHSELAGREGHFDISDVIKGICDKLISRHPHVFSTVIVNSSQEVLANWEEIKRKEKKKRKTSILDGVPQNMPALAIACRIQERASNVGFDWEKIEDVWEKVEEELREFSEAKKKGDQEKIEEEFGDLLFALVNLSRFQNINPEQALRKTIRKFEERFRYIEQKAEEQGRSLKDMSLSEMDAYWNEVKKLDKK